MTQSLMNVLIHVVFSTKNREPIIQPEIENAVHKFICGICENKESPVIKIGGHLDHIHIFASLGKDITVPKLISEIKSNSSRWIKTQGSTYKNFAWQNGYGAFSVSPETAN